MTNIIVISFTYLNYKKLMNSEELKLKYEDSIKEYNA